MKKRNYANDYQDRLACIQLDYKDQAQTNQQGFYNIWYSKFQGEGAEFGKGVDPSPYRCVVDRDAGKTRGTRPPFCIHFAHGKCSRGSNCQFLHRIPIDSDPVVTTIDAFGRDKFRLNRKDMGGVGSFENRCKTLYVGNIGVNDHMEEILQVHFGEWGEIETINVLPSKGVAFVTFKNLLNAEFAKEAMYGQTLESAEVINVRWATEDPNPEVMAARKRKAEEEIIKKIKAKLPNLGEDGNILDYEANYDYTKAVKPKEVPKPESPKSQGDIYRETYKKEHGVYPEGQENDFEAGLDLRSATLQYAIRQEKRKPKPQSTVLVAAYPSSDEDE